MHFETDHAFRREENKVEFLKGRFLDEKLPFLHRKKTENSFELSLSIFCPLTVYFNLEMQNSDYVRLLLGLKLRSMWKSANAETNERRWRTSRLTVDHHAYVNHCTTVSDLIHQSKMEHFSHLVADHQSDPKKLFATVDKFLHLSSEIKIASLL